MTTLEVLLVGVVLGMVLVLILSARNRSGPWT
jgi:hypothetical protein